MYNAKQQDDHEKSALIFDLITTREPLQIVKQNHLFGDTTQTHQLVLDEQLFCVPRIATSRISEFTSIFTDVYTLETHFGARDSVVA